MSRSLLALSFTLLVACAPADVVTPVSTNQTGDWWSTVGPRLGADSRRLHAEGAAFVATLGDVEARFDYDGGVLSAPGVPALSVRLATWEAGGPVQTSGRRSPALGACQIDGAVDPAGRCLPRLEFDHGGLVEWWASTEGGPRQGFEITGAETSEVRIDIATSEAVEREGDALAIGGWLVSEFAAWDASGAALPVRVVPGARSFAMVVSVEGAQFPVTVDPLYRPVGTVLEGSESGGQHGYSLASGGDLNGDGYDDLAVGAPSSGGGSVFVYYGSSAGVSTTAGSTIPSPHGPDTEFGASLLIDSDFDNDGLDDLLVGGPGYDSGAGIVTMYRGTASGVAGSSSYDSTLGTGARWGAAMVGMGDLTGDGRDDVVVGAPGYSSSLGAVVLLAGTSTSLSTSDFRTGDTNSELGTSFARGDFNADGQTDLAVGAPGGQYVYLYDGSAGSALLAGTPTQLIPNGSKPGHGYALAAFDHDSDGDDDLAVGAFDADGDAGRVSLYLGQSTLPNGAPSASHDGNAGAEFGRALHAPGDLDHDGSPELYVGAPGESSVHIATFTREGELYFAETIEGATSSGYGYAFADAGDVDGDGGPDTWIAAPDEDGTGAVHLLHGSTVAVMYASTEAETLYGETASNRFGMVLDFAGDVNGDGYDDVLIAAPVNDAVANNAGAVYCFHGSESGLAATATTTLYGEAADDRFGGALAGAGDTNNDGYDDVVIGASTHDGTANNAGRVYIYQGSGAGLATSAQATIDGKANGEQFGSSVAGGLRVFGGQYTDVVVGAPYATSSTGAGAAGQVRVYAGGSSGVSTTAGLTLEGEASGDYFGSSVAVVDLEHDYYSEVVVGAPNANPGGLADAGSVYTFPSGEGSHPTTPSVTISGSAAGDGLGRVVRNAGDVDSDGYEDVLITAIGVSSNRGGAYLHRSDGDNLLSTVAWSTTGINANDYLGVSAGAGDMNGDGLGDLAIGAYASDLAANDAGTIFVFTLADDLAEIEEQRLFGEDVGDYLGYGLAAGGDINGDGFDDLVGGAFSVDDAGNEAGAAYVWYGQPVDVDGDGIPSADDCNDGDATVGVANQFYYWDPDGDGYGNDGETTTTCRVPNGLYVTIGGDCDGANNVINPGATEVCDPDDTDEDCDGLANDADTGLTGTTTFYADNDLDGYGDPAVLVEACEAAAGRVDNAEDCDDAADTISPAEVEVCDAFATDEDCDGAINDADADVTGTSDYYADVDGDGYGASLIGSACELPAAASFGSGDCDDTRSDISPDEIEVCDAANADEDCDGLSGDADDTVVGTYLWFADADGDGYGDAASTASSCEQPPGFVANDDDCDDSRSNVNPDGSEVCDAFDVDEDCDGLADERDAEATGTVAAYQDADGDGFGDAFVGMVCSVAPGQSVESGDCDDSDGDVNPAQTEICDVVNNDEDCDGVADDADNNVDSSTQSTWYGDTDGDDYGDANVSVAACDAPADFVANALDCDGARADVHPGAEESDCADATDYNCDGATGYADADNDGWAACNDCDDGNAAAYPGGTETPADEADGDCDGFEACYIDVDADGYRMDDATIAGTIACTSSGEAGSNSMVGDCDDADATVSPAAQEGTGDSVDQDCDGTESCYADDDGDAFHDGMSTIVSDDTDCEDAGEAGLGSEGDCDVTRSDVHPGAEETDCADPTDYNCDGSTGYADNDGDGYAACAECDDTRDDISPSAVETCNGVDDDCDGSTDPDSAADVSVWEADADADGYTDPSVALTSCEPPVGYAAASTPADCDDTNGETFPGGIEVADDGVDQDCDGSDTVSSPDTGDTGQADTGGTWETGTDPDTGTVDTGTVDTGTADTGAVDTGTVDTGTVDTGAADTAETGDSDTGIDETGDTETGDTETGDSDTDSGETGDGEDDTDPDIADDTAAELAKDPADCGCASGSGWTPAALMGALLALRRRTLITLGSG